MRESNGFSKIFHKGRPQKLGLPVFLPPPTCPQGVRIWPIPYPLRTSAFNMVWQCNRWRCWFSTFCIWRYPQVGWYMATSSWQQEVGRL